MARNDRKKDENKSSNLKLIFISIIILIISVYVARSPLFTLNIDRPLKANYIELPDRIPFEGNLAPNDKLTKAKHLAKGALAGPETIVFTPDGSLYTGLLNGQIVKVDQDGSVHKIVQIGEEKDEKLCNKFPTSFDDLTRCGRPLGLRLINDSYIMYVADSSIGIFKVDLKQKTKQLILSNNDKRFGSAPLKLLNDLDIDGDDIYFIDSSYERGVHEAIEEHLEALPRGRLYKYNLKTDKLEFLLENLYFPNGLTLTPDKKALLINENSMSRILKFHLEGEKKGTREVFADIPGYGDTIRLTQHNTLLVPFAAARHNPFTALDAFARYPLIRTLLGFVLNMREVLRIHPKYGLLAEYDMNGKILKSWHDPTGKVVECTTNAIIHDNKLYLGSFYNDFIAVVDYP